MRASSTREQFIAQQKDVAAARDILPRETQILQIAVVSDRSHTLFSKGKLCAIFWQRVRDGK